MNLSSRHQTEAFSLLIDEIELGTEEIFYVRGNPDKPIPPNQDGVLTQAENGYLYVAGQTDSNPARSPLVADEMAASGGYAESHPWLKGGRAIVGYCGGQVKIERLTNKEPGATIRAALGSGIDDIFQLAKEDDEGRISGGLLSVTPDHILLP